MKKNLTHKKKETRVGSFVRLEPEFKERARIWGIKNKMTLTDIITEGISRVIGEEGKDD